MTSTAGQRSKLATTERSTVSLSDFEAELVKLETSNEHVNLLVYGDSNAGKTVLAGTAPGRTFWLIGEPGYKAASRQGARGSGRAIRNTAEAWAAVEWLESPSRQRGKRKCDVLDWLILDGLTTMQDRFRLSYAAEAFDINPAKRAHRNLPDRPDYFNTQNFMKAWIPRLVDMPVNLLITAHAYRTDLTDDAELLVFPGIQGKTTEVANAISGLMDATGYLEARMVRKRNTDDMVMRRRLWFTSPTGRTRKDEETVRYIAGDKFDCLGPYMDGPTIPAIMAKVNGEEE